MAEVDGPRDGKPTNSKLLPARDTLRVIAHIDMDAFYAQIEQVRDPSLSGKPVAVVQYPTTMHNMKDMAPDDNRIVEGSASSIIAVSYEARAFGVKRNMKGGEARKACPELSLVQVPTRNSKADISLYRQNGERVVEVLEAAGGALAAVEKASIDEVYVDVTRAATTVLSRVEAFDRQDSSSGPSCHEQQQQLEEDDKSCGVGEWGEWGDMGAGGWEQVASDAAGTHVAGLDDDPSDRAEGVSWWGKPPEALSRGDKLLVCGAAVVSRLREAVRSQLRYSCTAGIAHNKLLAKLCSNMHKPNAQTVLPWDIVPKVFRGLPVERVRGWGGKFGVRIAETLGVSTAGEVADKGPSALQRAFGEQEGWRVWQKSRGIDLEPVKPRTAPKSIGCSKTFPGRSRITSFAQAERWLSELSKDLVLRLDEQKHRQGEGQIPSKLSLSFSELQEGGKGKHASRSCRMPSKAEVSVVVDACMKLLRGYKMQQAPLALTMLGVSAHGFEGNEKDTPRIDSFFSSGPRPDAGVVGVRKRLLSQSSSPPPPQRGTNPADLAVKGGIPAAHKKPRVLADEGRPQERRGRPEVSYSVGGVDGRETKPDVSLNDNTGASGAEGLFAENRCSDGGRDGKKDRIDWNGEGDNGSVWEVEAEAEAEAGGCREGRDYGVMHQALPEETCEGGGIRGAGGAQAVRWNGHDARVGQNSGEVEAAFFADKSEKDDYHHYCESMGCGKQGLERVEEGGEQTHTGQGARSSGSLEHGSVFAGGAAACGAFGVVDPEVLKQLPLDIQREILTQQGGYRASRQGQRTSAPAGGRRGGSRKAGRARDKGQATISSFFGRHGGGCNR